MFEIDFRKDELILTKQRKNCFVAPGCPSLATVSYQKNIHNSVQN